MWSGMRHISMNFWFMRTIRPAASTTDIPSAVDSRVASRSDNEDRTFAAERLSLPRAAVKRSRRMATRAPLTSTVPVTRADSIGSCGGTAVYAAPTSAVWKTPQRIEMK